MQEQLGPYVDFYVPIRFAQRQPLVRLPYRTRQFLTFLTPERIRPSSRISGGFGFAPAGGNQRVPRPLSAEVYRLAAASSLRRKSYLGWLAPQRWQ
jgi:hypothetical protein